MSSSQKSPASTKRSRSSLGDESQYDNTFEHKSQRHKGPSSLRSTIIVGSHNRKSWEDLPVQSLGTMLLDGHRITNTEKDFLHSLLDRQDQNTIQSIKTVHKIVQHQHLAPERNFNVKESPLRRKTWEELPVQSLGTILLDGHRITAAEKDLLRSFLVKPQQNHSQTVDQDEAAHKDQDLPGEQMIRVESINSPSRSPVPSMSDSELERFVDL